MNIFHILLIAIFLEAIIISKKIDYYNNSVIMSRPTKLKKRVVQKLQEAFKLWCTTSEACCYAEISRSTYYDWLSTNQEFSDKIELSKKYLEYKSRAVIANSLENWDVKTAMWYLERKNKKEFNVQYLNITPERENKPQKMKIEVIRSSYENYDENWNPW